MSYIVIKTINGRQYRYLQRSYRVGKRVRTKCIYLGPVLGAQGSIIVRWPDLDEAAMLAEALAADAKYAAMKEQFFKEVGLKVGPSNPVPVEKEVRNPLTEAPAPVGAAAAAPAEAPADAPSTDAPDGAAAGGEASASEAS